MIDIPKENENHLLPYYICDIYVVQLLKATRNLVILTRYMFSDIRHIELWLILNFGGLNGTCYLTKYSFILCFPVGILAF